MKHGLIILFLFYGNFQLFAFSFSWGLHLQNNSNNEIVYSVKYSESKDYQTYVVRLDHSAGLYTFPGFTPDDDDISLLTFNNFVKDIIIYDLNGSVIMLIDDIRKILSIDDYVSEIEITEELVRIGNKKYQHLPKFTGDVINFPEKAFYIRNDSGNRLVIIAYFRTINGPIWPVTFGLISSTKVGMIIEVHWTELVGRGFLTTFSSLAYIDDFHRREFQENDGITLFYKYLIDIMVYDTDGNTILTKEDFTISRFVEYIYGSEKYGDRSFTMTISPEDMALGWKKYKHISPVNIREKQLEVINERNRLLNFPPVDWSGRDILE
jgi:hypothetical protein